MSDYHRIEGKLIPIELTEEIAAKILKEKGVVESNFDSTVEHLLEDFYEEYMEIEGKHFRVEDLKDHGNELDFVKLYPNEDGSFDFITLFYNGGVCLEEMLAEGLSDLEE